MLSFLEIRSLLLIFLLIGLIGLAALTVVWLQNRDRYKGLFFWALTYLCLTIGSLLIMLRGRISDFLSIIMGNFFMVFAIITFVVGLEKFINRKPSYHLLSAVGLVFLILYIYFTYAVPSITYRTFILSLFIMGGTLHSAWLMIKKTDPELRRFTRLSGYVLCGFSLAGGYIGLHVLLNPIPKQDLFQSGIINAVSILFYVILSVILLISLILMVNTRLINDVKKQEEKFYKAFDSSPNAIMLTRLSDGRIMEVNKGFEDISGYEKEEVLGKSTTDIRLWGDSSDRSMMVDALMREKNVRGLEIQARKKSGESIDGLLSCDVINIENEDYILSNISDISELVRLKNELEEMATHDHLTGLPNRRLFADRFAIAVANAKRHGWKSAIISIDVDHFKDINDRYGHEGGDKVLIEVATRLKDCLRKSDTVARFGGDEFVLLINELYKKEDINSIAEKIMNSINQPLRVGGVDITITISMGIAFYPDDGEVLEDLLKKSDESLYEIKRHGKDNFQIFGEMNTKNP